jgi:enediyne biosynthesis protein E4
LLAGVALPGHGRPISSMGAESHDYDNDGFSDIHVTALAGETFPLFHNDGVGQFTDATELSGLARATLRRSGWGNIIADFDNDGWKDVFTANSHVNDRIEAFEAHRYREPNSLFRNLGGGKFEDISEQIGKDFRTPRAHRGAVAADLNNDGRLDVVTTSLGDRAEIWENRSPGGSSWIVLKLIGTRSNRDGIGARVRLHGQTGLMTTAAGYASSTHAGMHFGVGRLKEIGRVEVVWPSGAVQTVERVEANRVRKITEPAGDRHKD